MSKQARFNYEVRKLQEKNIKTQAKLGILKIALVIVACLMVMNIFARIAYGKNMDNVKYIESEVDSPYDRAEWNGTEFVVDSYTGILYEENEDLTIKLYEDKDKKTYRYNQDTNTIEEVTIY